jgi:hypothetical protein
MRGGAEVMKNLTTLFMILITTPVFAVKIDANTPIEWNSLVIEEALKRVGLGWGSLSNYDLVEQRSVSYLVSRCVYWSEYALINRFTDFGEDGNYLPGKEEEIKEKAKNLCKKFGAELININNEIASIADYAHNATTKSSCENNRKAIWVDSESMCVPKNPCMFNQYENYCIDTDLTNYYEVPKGNIKSADVVNIYAKYQGFNCNVVEKDIFKEYGFTFVPCKGADYRVFKFDGGDVGQNVTDLFCFIVHGTMRLNHGGWPTICKTSRSSCETIKGLVGNKINVEYSDCDKQECSCIIGEYSEDAVSGYIWYGDPGIMKR